MTTRVMHAKPCELDWNPTKQTSPSHYFVYASASAYLTLATMPNFAALFTKTDTSGPIVCGRKDCKMKIFPAGTHLEYMHPLDPTQAGRWVCKECHNYYVQKTTTIRTR
jgi:hypothetical protein